MKAVIIGSDAKLKLSSISGSEITSIEISGKQKSFNDFCAFEELEKLEKILIREAEIDVANLQQNCSQENNIEKNIQVFQNIFCWTFFLVNFMQ